MRGPYPNGVPVQAGSDRESPDGREKSPRLPLLAGQSRIAERDEVISVVSPTPNNGHVTEAPQRAVAGIDNDRLKLTLSPCTSDKTIPACEGVVELKAHNEDASKAISAKQSNPC